MSDERARLFVALELLAPVRAALDEWGSEGLSGSEGWRRVGEQSLHVTLCFLGGQPVSEVVAIAHACSVVGGCPRPVLEVGEALWLPQRRPRVLAVGVSDPSGALSRLQARLAEELAQGGWYAPERRRFLAHVTVARARVRARGSSGARSEGRSGDRSSPRSTAALDLAPPAPMRFVGDSVALLRSRPAPGGSRYERLAGFALAEREGA